ncbi:hypothetical protein N431DRAFT_433653 [Stipitochalara longipes BDJ]|nr:hypothetical protein N431DRAFT_433653 [Stipitochalara longipes BDJ]
MALLYSILAISSESPLRILLRDRPQNAWLLISTIWISCIVIGWDMLLSNTTPLALTVIGVLGYGLALEIKWWYAHLVPAHDHLEHLAMDHTLTKRSTIPRAPNITLYPSKQSPFGKSPKSSEQSYMRMQGSDNDDTVTISWNIDPVTNVGAWDGENRPGDGYPLVLNDFDLSMD